MTSTNHDFQRDHSTPWPVEALLDRQVQRKLAPDSTAHSDDCGTPSYEPYDPGRLIIDAAQAHLHLDLLGRDERDTNIRFIPHKGLKAKAINGNFGADLEKAEQIQRDGYGVYLQPNPGGTLASEVTEGIALFFEHDNLSKNEQLAICAQRGLPDPTFRNETGGKSIHNYFVFERPISIERWSNIMLRLIEHVHSDKSCKNRNQMMRLAGSLYINEYGKTTGRCKIISITGARYPAELFEELLPPLQSRTRPKREKQESHAYSTKNVRQIIDAMKYIPRRVTGSGTYADYRNILWGLIAACREAGYDIELAIELMEEHSPSNQCGWDVQQVATSGGEQVGSGTFWWHAQQHGWDGRHA